MREIAHMGLPSVRRQGIQTRQALDYRLGLTGERARNACGFLGGLCLDREWKKKGSDGRCRKAPFSKAPPRKYAPSSCHYDLLNR